MPRGINDKKTKHGVGRIIPVLRLPLNECVTWRKSLTVSQPAFIHLIVGTGQGTSANQIRPQLSLTINTPTH